MSKYPANYKPDLSFFTDPPPDQNRTGKRYDSAILKFHREWHEPHGTGMDTDGEEHDFANLVEYKGDDH